MHVYKETDLEYDHEDYLVETTQSNLRRARNAHMFIGVLMGVIGTIAFQYIMLWVLNVV